MKQKADSPFRTNSIFMLIWRISFILILAVWIFTSPLKIEAREPIEPYNSIEEEYIAAIENFINTGNVIVPDGATFIYNGNTIQISDNHSNATENCRFVLENNIPVYEWSYNPYEMTYKFIISRILVTILIYNILTSIIKSFHSKHIEKRNRKSLMKIKNASLGNDASNTSFSCTTCSRFNECKCLKCMYLNKCTHCPSSDCEDAFEEENMNNPSNETNENEETLINENAGKCDYCEKNETCECIDCKYTNECPNCPYENCLEVFESTYLKQQDTNTENEDNN